MEIFMCLLGNLKVCSEETNIKFHVMYEKVCSEWNMLYLWPTIQNQIILPIAIIVPTQTTYFLFICFFQVQLQKRKQSLKAFPHITSTCCKVIHNRKVQWQKCSFPVCSNLLFCYKSLIKLICRQIELKWEKNLPGIVIATHWRGNWCMLNTGLIPGPVSSSMETLVYRYLVHPAGYPSSSLGMSDNCALMLDAKKKQPLGNF